MSNRLLRVTRCRIHRLAGVYLQHLLFAGILAAVSWPSSGYAQATADTCGVELSGADFTGAAADLSRVLDLLGRESRESFLVRRVSDRRSFDACLLPNAIERLSRALATPAPLARGATLLPVDVRIIENSRYPRDWNDGVQWGGAGLSSSLTAGAVFRWNGFEAAVVPVFTAHENATFDLLEYLDPNYSRWVDRWHGRFIDLPQRFGRFGFVGLDPGQSYARVSNGAWRVGISNENLAWGPARRNPLLLSGTAPGFPHVFVETARPVNAWIGSAELQLFWGRLSESDYFDYRPDNDHRALNGVIATMRPRGLDGLYLGVARLHSRSWSPGLSIGDVLIGPVTGIDPDSSGLPRDLRLYGVFLRWAAAPGGFEVYGEWARQDEWLHWVRLFDRVDVPQAYTLGLQKTVRRGDNAVRLSAEITHLSDNLPHRDVGRGLVTFYVSPHVVQGHTHRGQLLGAPIGPGSEAQFIGVDVFWHAGRTSFSLERARYDDDAYYAQWSQYHGPHGHDTEATFRAGHMLARPTFSVEAEFGIGFRYSRDFFGVFRSNFRDYPYWVEGNFSARLAGRWKPPAWSWQP